LLQKSYERRRRTDLLNELVKGNGLDNPRIDEMMLRVGINPREAFSCYLLVIEEWQGLSRQYWQDNFEALRALQDSIVDSLENCDKKVAWVNLEGIGVLDFGNSDSGMQDVKEYQAAVADRLREQVADRVPGVVLTIGIAEAASEISDLGARFRQSCTAVNIGRKIWPGRNTYYYLDLGIFQLLPWIEDREQVAGYIERTLGKLLRYDSQKKEEYLLTLEMILESDNLKEAAKKVFVHHKTIELRKRRIEEILGVSLSSFETRMTLSTALKLMRLDGGK